KKDLGVKSAKDLNGASICIQSGTTTELNLADYFRNNGMTYKPVVFDTSAQTAKGFDAGRCDVLTTDQSGLYALRLN
nr:amino acid ABC transporter substrate-binding protein [Vibrio cholerae]